MSVRVWAKGRGVCDESEVREFAVLWLFEIEVGPLQMVWVGPITLAKGLPYSQNVKFKWKTQLRQRL